MPRIAVDESLSNVKQALKSQGHQVLNLDKGLHEAEVIVISGMSRNQFGDNAISTEAPVIDASGLTAGQVVDEVERALNNKH